MKLSTLAYPVYSAARKMARTARINRILRRSVGPFAARFIFRFSGNGDRPLMIQGHQMFLAPPGRYPSPDMVADNYEKATTQLFKVLLKPGMTVVDVGANVGYFSILAAGLVGPGGRVYAFEPEPKNHDLLLRNIEINSYSNVSLFQEAVSDAPGNISFYLSEMDNGSHSIFEAGARGVSGQLSVATTTLDIFFEREGQPQIDLLKIDVEGAELLVLNGMEQLVQQNSGMNLIIEYCPTLLEAAGVRPIAVLDKLTSMNFRFRFVDDQNGGLMPDEVDPESIIDSLLRQENYVNLFCSRK